MNGLRYSGASWAKHRDDKLIAKGWKSSCRDCSVWFKSFTKPIKEVSTTGNTPTQKQNPIYEKLKQFWILWSSYCILVIFVDNFLYFGRRSVVKI